MKQGGGAHLTKPGWSRPHIHSTPTILALFGHKITLFKIQSARAQMGAGGLIPPSPLTLTTVWHSGSEPKRCDGSTRLIIIINRGIDLQHIHFYYSAPLRSLPYVRTCGIIGGTGVSGLTRSLATLLQGGSRSLQWSETGMEDPKRTP